MYRKTDSPELKRMDNKNQRFDYTNGDQKKLSDNKIEYDLQNISSEMPVNKKVEYVNDAFVLDVEQDGISAGGNEKNIGDITEAEDKDNKETPKFSDDPVLHLKRYLKSHRREIKSVIYVMLFTLYNVYFGFAVYYTWEKALTWCDGIKFLTVITVCAYVCAFYTYIFKAALLRPILRNTVPIQKLIQKSLGLKYSSHVIWSFVWIAVFTFLIIDTYDNRRRLISAGGLVALLVLGYIFSMHRSKVIWHQVQWGILLQFCLGLISLRWTAGKAVFRCFADKVTAFLAIADVGSTFVFSYLVTGVNNQLPVFAFQVLSVIIFFSFIVSILYYYGVMQVMVAKVGWLLQITLGTTACESMSAAGNIFLGMTEAPLLIRPYLPTMTKSELHAVMTGGFATIAGSVLAIFIKFNIDASHLLSASVMSAPAALVYSKLVYPETEESFTKAENIKIEKATEINALEAATKGASTAIKLVANIAANLIAFVAFIALIDNILQWLGSLVLFEQLSFQWLLSKAFIPLSLLLGVDYDDSEKVANLIGLKNIVNEFVAYERLSVYKKANELSARSEAIATFALCGFSNISSIGIQLGSLVAMAPERRSDLSQIAVRAMITGSVTCCMTACIAGTLLPY